jgi:hypothetical protein
MNWCILKYETGRHGAIPNSLCRLGVPCLLPLIEEYHPQAKRNISKPALVGVLFMPADENQVRVVLERVRYAESVWREAQGRLITISDRDIQIFLDGLDKRGKKPEKAKKQINMADAAELDWFTLFLNLYGLQAAIKRFGSDLRQQIAA